MDADNPAQPDLRDLVSARPGLQMDPKDGLSFEHVRLAEIADAHGTPCWVYGAATLRARYGKLDAAFTALGLPVHIHYAVKANDHLAILTLLRQLGAGADVVSGGEFMRASRAGILPENMVFSGVGKSTAELELAIGAGVGQINAESAEELAMISAVAANMNRTAKVALRMNPDVDAGTHEKLSTGRAGDKFGIAAGDIPALYAQAAGLPGLRPVGLALHIGSQILAPAPYATAYARAAAMVRGLREQGQKITALDLGGGLGIGYSDGPGMSATAYAAVVHRELGELDLRLMLEPGRYIVGPAGLLLASVVLQKRTGDKRFVVLDAAMNDLMRPAMYDAWHGIVPLDHAAYTARAEPADIVGPVCEPGDRFAKARPMPALNPGARVAILDAGAYGAVMSSHYNARPRAAAVLVDGGKFDLITPRQRLEELWAHEIVPNQAG
jgi:diaminopimelate decarboxylase